MSTPLNQKVKTMNDEERNFLKSENIKEEFEEYKKFAYKKNFFVMALALVLATQTQKFASSMTESLVMPIINYLISATNGNWRNLVFAPVQGLELEIGNLVNAFLEFTIVTIMLYLIFQKIIKRFDPDAVLAVNEGRVSLGIIDEKTQKSTNPKDQNN
jgi:large-conductance mechanosensitive channel